MWESASCSCHHASSDRWPHISTMDGFDPFGPRSQNKTSQVALTRAFYLSNRITTVGGGGAFSPFSPFRKLVLQPGVAVHTFNPSACEAEAGGFWDGGLPGLLSKTLSQDNETAVFSTTHFSHPLGKKITGLCIGLCICNYILKLMSNVYF